MSLNVKKLTPQELYELIGKLIEEIKLRKYSYQTGKAYISVVKRFLKSEKTPAEACEIDLNIENSWEDLIREAIYHQTKLTMFISDEANA